MAVKRKHVGVGTAKRSTGACRRTRGSGAARGSVLRSSGWLDRGPASVLPAVEHRVALRLGTEPSERSPELSVNRKGVYLQQSPISDIMSFTIGRATGRPSSGAGWAGRLCCLSESARSHCSPEVRDVHPAEVHQRARQLGADQRHDRTPPPHRPGFRNPV